MEENYKCSMEIFNTKISKYLSEVFGKPVTQKESGKFNSLFYTTEYASNGRAIVRVFTESYLGESEKSEIINLCSKVNIFLDTDNLDVLNKLEQLTK